MKEEIKTTQMLHDHEAEVNALGTVINYAYNHHIENKDYIFKFLESVTPDTFFNADTKTVFGIICKIDAEGREVNKMSVLMEAMKQCPEQMEKVTNIVGSYLPTIEEVFLNVIPHLNDIAQKRRIWAISASLKDAGTNMQYDTDKAIQEALDALQDVGTKTNKRTTTNGSDVLKELIKIYEENLNGVSHLSTMTGFPELDKQGGLFASDLIIIGASTSVGKSAFATSLIQEGLREHKKVALYNLEMTNVQTMARLIAPYAKMSCSDILRRQGSEYGREDLLKAVVSFNDIAYNIKFPDEGVKTIDQVILSIRKLKRQENISGAVIDYLGLLGGKDKNESTESFMARCARRLKDLANYLNIWIIALVQFNRDKDNFTPSLNRLRDSAQIADAADIVMLLHRPEHTNPNGSYDAPFENVMIKDTAEVLVEKFRNGKTDKFIVGFQKEFTRFVHLDKLPLKAVDVTKADKEYKMPF